MDTGSIGNRDWFLQSNRADNSWSGSCRATQVPDGPTCGLLFSTRFFFVVGTVQFPQLQFFVRVSASLSLRVCILPRARLFGKPIANTELQYIDRLTDVGFISLVSSSVTQLVGPVTTVFCLHNGLRDDVFISPRRCVHSQRVQICRGAISSGLIICPSSLFFQPGIAFSSRSHSRYILQSG